MSAKNYPPEYRRQLLEIAAQEEGRKMTGYAAIMQASGRKDGAVRDWAQALARELARKELAGPQAEMQQLSERAEQAESVVQQLQTEVETLRGELAQRDARKAERVEREKEAEQARQIKEARRQASINQGSSIGPLSVRPKPTPPASFEAALSRARVAWLEEGLKDAMSRRNETDIRRIYEELHELAPERAKALMGGPFRK